MISVYVISKSLKALQAPLPPGSATDPHPERIGQA